MHYDSKTPVQDLRANVCCEAPSPSRTIKDNVAETTERLHMIESRVDALNRFIWAKEDCPPEKDIEVVDMDSNIVCNLDIARRINVKLERIMTGLGL